MITRQPRGKPRSTGIRPRHPGPGRTHLRVPEARRALSLVQDGSQVTIGLLHSFLPPSSETDQTGLINLCNSSCSYLLGWAARVPPRSRPGTARLGQWAGNLYLRPREKQSGPQRGRELRVRVCPQNRCRGKRSEHPNAPGHWARFQGLKLLGVRE